MSLNNPELIIAKLERIVRSNSVRSSAESIIIGDREKQEICSLIGSLGASIEQQQSVRDKHLPSIHTFIRHLPLAIAILDRDMNYLAVSDRWISDYKLEKTELIGRNYYDVFPELPTRWRKNCERCLTGQVEVLGQEEDFWVREDGTVDWLRWQLRPWHNCEGEIGGLTICSEVITEQRLLQQKIESTEGQMRAVFAGMNELVFTVELHSDSILILPTKFFDVYDRAIVDRIIAKTQEQLLDDGETSFCKPSIERVLLEQSTINFEYSLQLNDSSAHCPASLIWFSVNISPISDSSVIWIARDVTNRKETEEEILYAEKELAQVTLQSIGDAVITTDAYGRIQYLNPAAEHLTGWSIAEARGKPLPEVFCLINEFSQDAMQRDLARKDASSASESFGRVSRLEETGEGGGFTHKRQHQEAIANPIDRVSRSHKVCKLAAKNSLLARNGTCYEIEGLASPIMNRQEKLVGTVIVFRDVTKARKMARKLSWQASHDSLTKLYNRRKFEEYAEREISNAQLYQSHHALCYLDLDRFKIVNDTCGHAAGDKLLQQVTSLLKQRIRRTDIFARLGGDEFGIIFHQCSIEIALELANNLRQLIEDFRFIWSDKVFSHWS